MAIKRERLAHPFFIALFGAVVAFALALMLPHERLVQRLKHAEPNALSVAYLEAWLRVKHDDLELISVLAHQYIQSGRSEEADPLVARMLLAPDATVRRNALLLQIQIAEQRVYALQPEDPQRAALLQAVATALTKTQEYTWDTAALQNLAAQSRALNLPALSAAFYRRLAQQDPAHSGAWQALVSELSLAGSRYRDAAMAAFAAQTASTSLADQRKYFLSGLKALQSGNLLQLALTEAQERAGPFLENDAETLRFLITLARSANRPDLAEKYAKRLLSVLQTGVSSARDMLEHYGMGALANANNDNPGAAAGRPLYLDGVKGNALRRTLDRRAGIVRVATSPVQPGGNDAVPGIAARSNTALAKNPPENQQPSINDDFELAYNVFLANQDLSAALRVADAANRRSPGNPLWMKRRATVNEWKGQPAQALQVWLEMARATNSPEAWQAVLRLAPGLNDDIAYLAALRHQVGNSATELVLIDQLVATYERLDQVDQALAFLDSRLATSGHRKEILARYAALAERAGKDDLALRAYLRLNREFGPQTAYALKLANIYTARGDFSAACKVLVSAQEKVAPADVFYWRALVQTAVRAERAERDDIAREASRHLIASNKATPADLENMISLWDEYPIDAGRLAELAFRQSGKIESLQEAVYQYSRAKAWARIDRLLNALTPEQVAAAENSSAFLMAKAEFLRQSGHNDAALEALRAAVALDGSAGEVRAAFLWALVERGNDIELAATLKRWRNDAESDAKLWGAYAAGYLRLSDEVNSLRFFHKQGSEKLKDPLWALAYADAREDFGQADIAWIIRRHAWLEISKRRAALLGPTPASADVQQPADKVGNGDGSDADIALQDEENRAELRARSIMLSQSFAGGDFSRNLLRHVLHQNSSDQSRTPPRSIALPGPQLASDDPGAANAPTRAEAVAEDVALAWALSNEQYELARTWLAQHYASQLERPAYAEVTIALAADDQPALEKLLADNADRIPLMNRIDANLRLDRNNEAQRLAFTGLEKNPDNEELQSRVRETALSNAGYVEPRISAFRQSPLRFVETDLLARWRLTERFSLDIQETLRNQHSDNPTQLVNVPAHDRSLTLGLGWKTSDTDLLFEAGARNAVKSFTLARFTASWNQLSMLTWNAAAAYNQEATDSAELRVGGVKDSALLGANWRFGTHEFAQAQAQAARYYAQDRTVLGSGTQFEVELGYHFRLEYPDFTLKAVVTRAAYHGSGDAGTLFGRLSPDGVATVAEVLPASFTQAGLVFSFGTDLQETYTHAWRPFMEIGLLRDTREGWTRTGRLGLAGSVWGNDHAMLYYAHDRSAGNGGAAVSEFSLRYRWYY